MSDSNHVSNNGGAGWLCLAIVIIALLALSSGGIGGGGHGGHGGGRNGIVHVGFPHHR